MVLDDNLGRNMGVEKGRGQFQEKSEGNLEQENFVPEPKGYFTALTPHSWPIHLSRQGEVKGCVWTLRQELLGL